MITTSLLVIKGGQQEVGEEWGLLNRETGARTGGSRDENGLNIESQKKSLIQTARLDKLAKRKVQGLIARADYVQKVVFRFTRQQQLLRQQTQHAQESTKKANCISLIQV